MDVLRNIALCFFIALLVNYGALVIESDFINSFMSDKLLWVLITLMTINVTTSSVIMTKLREIVDATGGSFPDSVNELRLVFKEYLWMIIIAFLVSVAEDSVLLSKYLPLFDFVVNVVLTTILGYAIYVLYDLAKSIFILLEYEHNNSG